MDIILSTKNHCMVRREVMRKQSSLNDAFGGITDFK